MEKSKEVKTFPTMKKVGLFLGLALFALFMLIPQVPGLETPGKKALALTALIITWWITEPIPIWITSILPLGLAPLIGLAGTKAAEGGPNIYVNYSSPVVMMCIGVFIMAAVIEKWNLHKRLALTIVDKIGNTPEKIVLAFGVAVAFVSMFMSNTTATAMLLPIGIALLKQLGLSKEDGFSKALILMIPFAANIGGMGTVIGSGTNLAGAAVIREIANIDITFAEWLKIGLPFVVLLLPLSAFALNKVFKVKGTDLGDTDTIRKELKSLGPMTKAEKITTVYLIFAIAGFAFAEQISNVIPLMTDVGWGIVVGIAAFLIPVDFKSGEFLMDSKTGIKQVSWSTFLLLGGALTLGEIFTKTGIAKWLAAQLGFLSAFPEIAVIIIVAVLVAFITEAASNLVVASAFLPPAFAIATELGINPMFLMMTVTLASSFAYMLPSGTPPNALAFGSGFIEMKDLVKAGFVVKMISIVLFPVVMYLISAPLTSLF